MAKATQSQHAAPARAARKPHPPFALNAESRAFLKRAAAYVKADQAFERARAAESDVMDFNYSPATCRLRDAWHRETREMRKYADRMSKRVSAKKKQTLSDVLTLALAGHHASAAYQALARATVRVAGLEGAV